MTPRPKRRWYQFSLRRLLIAMALSPPLLGWGWPIVKAVITPPELELVICGHPVSSVSWEEAKRAVEQMQERKALQQGRANRP